MRSNSFQTYTIYVQNNTAFFAEARNISEDDLTSTRRLNESVAYESLS